MDDGPRKGIVRKLMDAGVGKAGSEEDRNFSALFWEKSRGLFRRESRPAATEQNDEKERQEKKRTARASHRISSSFTSL